MKKIFVILMSAMLIFSALVGCSPSEKEGASSVEEKPVEKGSYTVGSRTTTEWSSSWIGLKYTLNESQIMTTDEELEQMMQIGADALFEDSETGEKIVDYAKVSTVYEMMAVDTSGNNIIVMAEKLALSNITMSQYIEALKKQSENLQGTIQFAEPTVRTIAGTEFTELNATMTVGEASVGQIYFLKKIEDRMIAVIVTHVTDGAVDTMLEGFSSYSGAQAGLAA